VYSFLLGKFAFLGPFVDDDDLSDFMTAPHRSLNFPLQATSKKEALPARGTSPMDSFTRTRALFLFLIGV